MTTEWWRRWRRWMVTMYIVIGIVTYGFAAQTRLEWATKVCNSSPTAMPSECYGPPTAAWAFFSAIFWPLWWSWELQSHGS